MLSKSASLLATLSKRHAIEFSGKSFLQISAVNKASSRKIIWPQSSVYRGTVVMPARGIVSDLFTAPVVKERD